MSRDYTQMREQLRLVSCANWMGGGKQTAKPTPDEKSLVVVVGFFAACPLKCGCRRHTRKTIKVPSPIWRVKRASPTPVVCCFFWWCGVRRPNPLRKLWVCFELSKKSSGGHPTPVPHPVAAQGGT